MLHNAHPDTSKLDRLAAKVLRAAIYWERQRAEHEGSSSRGSFSAKADDAELAKATAEYRQALVDETVPEDGPTFTPAPVA